MVKAMKNAILVFFILIQPVYTYSAYRDDVTPEAIIPTPPTVTAEIRREITPYFELRTSKAVWAKIESPLNTEGIGYLGPLLYTIGLVILAVDAIVGIVTASPFRERHYNMVSYWKISGQVTDKSGNALESFPIRVNVCVMPPKGNVWRLGGQKFDKTDKDGRFSTLVSGPAPDTIDDRLDVTISVGHERHYTRELATIGTNATKPTAPDGYIWSKYGAPGDKKVYLEKFAKIEPVLKKTQDPSEFVEYAKKIGSGYPPECLDIVIDRFDEFFYVDTKNIGSRVFKNPQDIFHEQSQLISYIKVRDGKRLKTAIKILKGMFLLDRDREAILSIFAQKYGSAPLEIKREMLDLVGTLAQKGKNSSGLLAFLEVIRDGEPDAQLVAKVSGDIELLKNPQPEKAPEKWKYIPPPYKKTYTARSKKKIGNRPELEIRSGINVELVEAPVVTVDRLLDIPDGANVISRVYGFKVKSRELSAKTDIVLRYSTKTDPCPGKPRSSLKTIYFGNPNHIKSPGNEGNDATGERYGELGNIEDVDFLVALACVGN